MIAHAFGHFRESVAMRMSYLIRDVNNWFARTAYQRGIALGLRVRLCRSGGGVGLRGGPLRTKLHRGGPDVDPGTQEGRYMR